MPMDSRTDKLSYTSNSPDETFQFGKQIAGKLSHGSIVALNGELGSGKTCLTKGIAAGLGIEEIVASPTYTIVNQYEFNHEYFCNRKRLQRVHESDELHEFIFFHIDVYRLNNEKEFEDIGGKEILSSGGICIIEWSDKIKNLLPPNTITVNIEITSEDSRKIKISGLKL